MRGKRAKKRDLVADERYGDPIVTQFINYVMLDGKKATARKLVYEAFEGLEAEEKVVSVESKSEDKKEGKKDGNKDSKAQTKKLKPLDIFLKALNNAKPSLEIRSRRIGGANYQVPVPVSPERQTTLAMRWIISAARETRKTTSTAESLREEIMQAFNGEGYAVRKREDMEKMAEANKAFAQFA
ncbi:MAG: 30S ribosomal protein S7 [Candidatus Dojkabacteria bacterium]